MSQIASIDTSLVLLLSDLRQVIESAKRNVAEVARQFGKVDAVSQQSGISDAVSRESGIVDAVPPQLLPWTHYREEVPDLSAD